MGFSVKPELLEEVAVSNKLDFDVTVNGSNGEVTSIRMRKSP